MILPAGPHRLYVAYFDKAHIDDAESERHIEFLVDCDPIIGWVVEEDDPPRHMPQPITPKAVLTAGGHHRIVGDVPELIRRDAIVLAMGMWLRMRGEDSRD